MPEIPTPGEVAFMAWECAMLNRAIEEGTPLWPLLGAHEQHAWEAAAEAVLDTADFPTLYERWRKQQETRDV